MLARDNKYNLSPKKQSSPVLGAGNIPHSSQTNFFRFELRTMDSFYSIVSLTPPAPLRPASSPPARK